MLVDTAIFLSYFLVGLAVLIRAVQEGHVSQYAFFHSYLVYFLVTGAVGLATQILYPAFHPYFFWLRFFTLVIAEFVLLVQIGDHAFANYPALRSLGRLMTLGITVVFSVAFILPPLFEARSSKIAIYDLVKRSALTKAVIILVLVGLARYFRVSLGRNIGGIALGLMAYLGINTANFALVERLGWANYGSVFSVIGPVSQTLMVLIWVVSLWKYQPVLQPAVVERAGESQEPLPDRLGRYNTALDRLLRR